jgi:hypothetical protein
LPGARIALSNRAAQDEPLLGIESDIADLAASNEVGFPIAKEDGDGDGASGEGHFGRAAGRARLARHAGVTFMR